MSAFAKRLWIVGLLVVAPAVAMACSVPVFRYALDHWRPDAYQVFVYHEQDLDEQEESLLQRIRQEADAGANVQVRTIDLRDELEPRDRLRWERMGDEALAGDQSLPSMIVHLPTGIGDGEAPVHASAWDAAETERLLSSPARVELSERLIRGEVVWVYLESSESDDDEARFELLRSELARQQETLELPEIDPADLDEMSEGAEELQIQFSALRVARDDPAEKWFIEMLLSVEPDLRDESLVDEAMVFPVFGRGRALYALVGDGINADMIEEAAVFLTGACQCTVKAENPGVDLLIPVLWDQVIESPEPEAFDLPLVGLTASLSAEDAAADVSEGDSAADTDPAPTSIDSATTGPGDSLAISSETSAETMSEEHGTHDALSSAEGPLGSDTGSDWGRWLPWGVVLVVGAIVVLSGATILRRQESR